MAGGKATLNDSHVVMHVLFPQQCKEFIDDGVSGTNFDRPGWNKLQEEMESGKIKVVITKNLSRLGRNHIPKSYFIEIFFPDTNNGFKSQSAFEKSSINRSALLLNSCSISTG